MIYPAPVGVPPVRRRRLAPELLPFPTGAQLDLLKAALLPAEQAAPAWRRWKARRPRFETLDQPSGRMLTQVWANRDAAGVSSADRTFLKRLHDRTLACNAAKLLGALDVTGLLVDTGIRVLFFKGVDLIAVYPERLGLRPISDVDVLIPEAEVDQAEAVLAAAGCTPKSRLDATSLLKSHRHARTYVCPSGSELDVHVWGLKTAGDDRAMFDSAREATLLERPVSIPSATESLITAIGTAFVGRGLGAPMRWISDAMLLFAVEGDHVDWDILLARAGRPGLTLSLAAGLGLLAREFNAPVPADALTELRRRKVSWRERGAYWAAVDDPPIVSNLLYHLEQHRTRRLCYQADVPRGFVKYLAQSPRVGTGKRRDVLKNCARRACNDGGFWHLGGR